MHHNAPKEVGMAKMKLGEALDMLRVALRRIEPSAGASRDLLVAHLTAAIRLGEEMAVELEG